MKYNFKEVRTSCGIKQKDVADALGVTASFIARIESGSKYPTFPFAVAMAEFYGVSLDDFVSNETENDKKNLEN